MACAPSCKVDYEGIFAALTGAPIVGDERGQIPAFGADLTRHYANQVSHLAESGVAGLLDLLRAEPRANEAQNAFDHMTTNVLPSWSPPRRAPLTS